MFEPLRGAHDIVLGLSRDVVVKQPHLQHLPLPRRRLNGVALVLKVVREFLLGLRLGHLKTLEVEDANEISINCHGICVNRK